MGANLVLLKTNIDNVILVSVMTQPSIVKKGGWQHEKNKY